MAIAISRMKYDGRLDVADGLARLVASGPVPAADLVVPIPLSTARLRERGFNQAVELARYPPRRLDEDALSRATTHRNQVGRRGSERRREMHGAFCARVDRVYGQRILILDDVITTGATVGAAARALFDAGAKEVRVLALARSVRWQDPVACNAENRAFRQMGLGRGTVF